MSSRTTLFHLLGALALLAGPGGVMAVDAPASPVAVTDFASHADLALSGEGPWYRLELSMALRFAARHADLRDVRVFDAQGQVQAYALTREQAEPAVTQQESQARLFPLYGAADATPDLSSIRVQRGTDGTLIQVLPEASPGAKGQVLRGWLLDGGALDLPLQRLILDWSAESEGFQRFSIEASDDLQQWQPWGEGQIARLTFAAERIEQPEVELPGQSARYLRLLWQAPTQAPQLQGARLVGASRGETAASLSWSEPLPGRRLESGEYQWELPLALPLQRLRLDLQHPNTLAPVIVSGRTPPASAWQPLARGLLYRLPEGGRQARQDELQLPGWPVQQLNLRVDARGGGLGSEVPQARVAVESAELVFLARGNGPYTLALGSASARASDLPVETLIPGFSAARLGGLGIANVVGLRQNAAPAVVTAPPGTDWKRFGLWAVLLAGVALLAGMAYSLLRAQRQQP